MEWDSDYRYEPLPQFQQIFQCLPFSRYKNPTLETGDKIIMPQSSLVKLIESRTRNPWFFKIRTFDSDVISHCGVLEFDAEEGCVHMPDWMMKNLEIKEGDSVFLQNTRVSKACYVKLQPHTTSFTEISDIRAVLEQKLRGFSCLSRGDTIMIPYNDKEYYIDVLEVKPGPDAVTLIETDCHVDFEMPLDYKEIEKKEVINKVDCKDVEVKEVVKKLDNGEEKKFRSFTGMGRRLDGQLQDKACHEFSATVTHEDAEKKSKDNQVVEEEKKDKFKAFTGRSRVLGST